jgi:hypothetical protein
MGFYSDTFRACAAMASRSKARLDRELELRKEIQAENRRAGNREPSERKPKSKPSEQAIIEARQAGLSYEDIAAKCDTTYANVHYVLRKKGMVQNRRIAKHTESTHAHVIDLAKQGYKDKDISAVTGINPSLVGQWRRDAGFTKYTHRNK